MSFRGVESDKGTIVVKSIRFVAVVAVRWMVVKIWPLLYNHPANENSSPIFRYFMLDTSGHRQL